MNRSELEARLLESRVPPRAFSLYGDEGEGERYLLEMESDGRWSVYYSERGERVSLVRFDDEESACKYFFHWILASLSL